MPLPTPLSFAAPADEPPWLSNFVTVITEKMAEKFVETLDQKLSDQAEKVSQDTALKIVTLEQQVGSNFATVNDALKLIGGTFDDLSQTVNDNEADRVREVTDIHTKIDSNRIQMERELSRLQSHVRSLSPAPSTSSTHQPPPPPSASQGTRPSDFSMEICISGLEEQGDEGLFHQCQLEVFEVMGCNYGQFQVEQCSRVGREQPPSGSGRSPKRRPRRVKVRFTDPNYKNTIMEGRHNLRGGRIYVNDYFPESIEKERRRLYPIMAKARGIGDYTDRITLEGAKIILDGNPIGVNNLDDLPADIHPRDICTERRGNQTFFFKMDSPLSNHHPCSFSVWGTTFNCSEQAYFAKKAEMCKDDLALGNILKATNPGTQKFHGGRIKTTPDWEQKKVGIMKQVCTEKFRQNPRLSAFLLKTENTLLLEDNVSDGFWGIKMSRNDPRSSNTAYHKANNMGIILMQIRESLRNANQDTSSASS
jgi:hypothetical protein